MLQNIFIIHSTEKEREREREGFYVLAINKFDIRKCFDGNILGPFLLEVIVGHVDLINYLYILFVLFSVSPFYCLSSVFVLVFSFVYCFNFVLPLLSLIIYIFFSLFALSFFNFRAYVHLFIACPSMMMQGLISLLTLLFLYSSSLCHFLFLYVHYKPDEYKDATISL